MTGSRVLITGGAGFIGTNLAHRFASLGHRVTVFDNLSRQGVEKNAAWLRTQHAESIRIEVADVRDRAKVASEVKGADTVIHLAAQVAVTSSLTDPRYDFDVNAGGTLNVLEALRSVNPAAVLIFTSTNKVYGQLEDLNLVQTTTRYQPKGETAAVNEDSPLDFHSPYGCSKGTADQYVLDYARSFAIPAVVFRMSCIYGPHQMGTEDQGWIAHFLREAMADKPITIFGDGRQVRDILFADDLVDAFLLARANAAEISGEAFNIGGGLKNTISLIELLREIHDLEGKTPSIQWSDWRQGDQRYYVSDTRKFGVATGWHPKVGAQTGIKRLHEWLSNEYDSYPRSEAGGENAVLAY
jgi:CDP-paratose 2-epimerase